MVACLKCFYAASFLSLSSFNVSSQQAFSEALIKDCYLMVSVSGFFLVDLELRKLFSPCYPLMHLAEESL